MVMAPVWDARTGEVTFVDDGEPDPPPVLPTIEDYKAAVQSHIDDAARSRLYSDGNSLAIYTASTNPQWAAEAVAFVAWRDAVWSQIYALWADPPDPPPSPADLVASLPEIVWPV